MAKLQAGGRRNQAQVQKEIQRGIKKAQAGVGVAKQQNRMQNKKAPKKKK